MISQEDMGSKPLNFEHYFSKASKKRVPNVLKEYYKFLRVPEMGNLAGGLPFLQSFPFDALKISSVQPGNLICPRDKDVEGKSIDASTLHIHIPRSSQGLRSLRNVDLDTALQYGSAQGYPPLHAWLRKLTTSVYHPNIPYEGGADIMITGGSADGLAKVYEVLFNHWDKDLNDIRDREGLIVEEFVYAPPIAQIKPRDVNIVPIKMDCEGMLAYGAGSLFDVLQNWNLSAGKRPHALYIIPTGQNPTSGVLSFSRRKEIYKICATFNLIIIEDDPYWNLYYPSAQRISLKYRHAYSSTNFPTSVSYDYSTQCSRGQSTGYRFLDELIPSFLSIDSDGRVIRLDTFSKTIAPGCRLGWITAQPSMCEQLFRVTDSTTQQPSGFVQAIVAQLLGEFGTNAFSEPTVSSTAERSTGWGVDGWIHRLEGLRSTYERRMIAMATIFEEGRVMTSEVGQKEIFSFNWPMGGMFLWVRINISNHPLVSSIDPRRLMLALWILCTQPPYLVLMNPGGDFAANDAIKEANGYQFLRFCFAAVEEDILEAKSQAFVEACQNFWSIHEFKHINYILQEEDALSSINQTAGEVAKLDREIIGDW